jgi:hypothetical protein
MKRGIYLALIPRLALVALVILPLSVVRLGTAAECKIASPCTFTFGATSGKNPRSQGLTIDVVGGLYFSTTVTLKTTANGVQWLSVVPPTGTLGGGAIGAPTVLPEVVVNSRSLPVGTYNAEILVKVRGGGDPSVAIPVTLKVE